MPSEGDAFVIREMSLSDADSVLAFVKALGAWFNEQGLAQMAVDVRSHKGYVAVVGEGIVGFLTWTPVDRDTAELSWMGVAEPRQRQGIGTALLSAVRLALRQRAFHYLIVSTVADNVAYEPYDRTRRFYRSRGFTDDRVDARYWGEGDDRYDRLVLRLDLTKVIGPAPGSRRG